MLKYTCQVINLIPSHKETPACCPGANANLSFIVGIETPQQFFDFCRETFSHAIFEGAEGDH
jgi:hypothetical protein